MFVKHLQQYLDRFTQGENGRQGNAVSNARAYIELENGTLAEIRRMEVLESTIIGDSSITVVMKADKSHKLAVKSPTFNKT